MSIKSRFRINQKIRIMGYSANNPRGDVGKTAYVKNIAKEGSNITGKIIIFYEPIDRYDGGEFYAYEEDVQAIEEAYPENNIIHRKIAEGEKEQLIEMGFIEQDGTITDKGYKFIKTFE